MINIGDIVKIDYPFNEAFPDTYLVIDIQDTTCFLDGIESAFDSRFLKKV